MQNQPSEWFFKKGVMRNFSKFTKKHLCRNLFLEKIKLCRFAASFKTRGAQVFSCEYCEIIRTPYLQNTTRQLLLVKAVLANSVNTKRRLSKSRLQRRCFLVKFPKFVSAEQHRTTAFDYSSINSSEGRVGKRNCKL